MIAPLSSDLRLRILLATYGGISFRPAAATINAAIATAINYFAAFGYDSDAVRKSSALSTRKCRSLQLYSFS